MGEKILLGILGGGNLILFIKFLIERYDRKQERKEDKDEKKQERDEENNRKHFEDRLTLLEKDGIRTQLLILILLKPEEHTEILRVAEHYFKDLKGNWYMTSIFSNWLKSTRTGEPEWFDSKE